MVKRLLRRLAGTLTRRRGDTAARATEAALKDLERKVDAEFDRGNAALALHKLRRARKRYPSDPEVALLVAEICYDRGLWREADAAFGAVTALWPDEPYGPAMAGAARLEGGDLDGSGEVLREALRRDKESPEALYWQAALHDLNGEGGSAKRLYRAAAARAPDDFPPPCRLTTRRFQQLAERALRQLSREYEGFAEALAACNVELRVQEVPTRMQIEQDGIEPLWLGAFLGHSVTDRSLEDPWSGMPGLVFLFQRNIERDCRDEAEVARQVRITLLHEIAHAQGREEDWMEERNLA